MMPTFGGKYAVSDEIGYGGCGTVFLGVHTIAGKEVAIKVEPLPPPEPSTSANPTKAFSPLPGAKGKERAKENVFVNPMTSDAKAQQIANLTSPLKQESKIYKALCGAPGIPYLLFSGRHGPYNVLVLDLMGSSLEDLFKMCNRHFTLKTVLMLADQLLQRIETLHSRDLLHRDIKPANFVMGIGSNENLVNVIDFGLAKRFRDPMTNLHIPYSHDVDAAGEGLHGVGTSLFASLNTHLGIESSRRDDLEALAYMLIYFLRGTLPWRRLKGETVRETWDVIRDKKLETEELLTVGLPTEFDTLYRYARGLSFEDLPDYQGLRDMFRTLADSKGIQYDWVFDWTVGRNKPSKVSHGRGHRKNCAACEARALQEKACAKPVIRRKTTDFPQPQPRRMTAPTRRASDPIFPNTLTQVFEAARQEQAMKIEQRPRGAWAQAEREKVVKGGGMAAALVQ